MIRKIPVLFCVILICFFTVNQPLFAEEQSEQFYKTSADLQRVLLENFDAYEKEEIFRVLATVHTLSPAYMATKEVSNQIFPLYDLKYELMNFRYLLTDEEYALARVLQKTTKVDGPQFKDNAIDLIVVFKQEKGQWKLWSQVILSIEYLN